MMDRPNRARGKPTRRAQHRPQKSHREQEQREIVVPLGKLADHAARHGELGVPMNIICPGLFVMHAAVEEMKLGRRFLAVEAEVQMRAARMKQQQSRAQQRQKPVVMG